MCERSKRYENRYEPTGLYIFMVPSCGKELLHGVDMTYKLNPEIRKILSPVVLAFPDGTKQQYVDGNTVADDVFDHKYLISTVRAVDDIIELKLVEQEAPNMNWSGEAATSFF